MDLDERLEECRFYVNQINYFDPDPFYVRKLFIDFLGQSCNIVNGIFKEADRDFGLFMKDKHSPANFRKKATEKKDEKALEFHQWFNERYDQEHKMPYLKFILKAKKYLDDTNELPCPIVKLRTKERYHNDPCHPIPIQFENDRLSKDSLKVSMYRYGRFFIDRVNKKRKEQMEPTISPNEVAASCFLPLEADCNEEQYFEIGLASKLYISTLRDLVAESRSKIKSLTSF